MASLKLGASRSQAGCASRHAFLLDSLAPDRCIFKCRIRQTVLPVPVEDQKPRSRAKRKGLPQLLHNPQARWMLCDVAVQDAPPIMCDHEKAVQHAEPDGGNREEVHRGHHFLMV